MKHFVVFSIAAASILTAAAQTTTVPAATANPAAEGAKKPGVIRIGLVQPKIDMGSPAANSPDALRTLIAQYLAGPAVEITPMAAMVPLQIEAEAKQKECDYILSAGLTQQQKKSGLGFLKNAQSMAGMVPVIGMAGRAGAVVGQAAAQTAISMAGQLASGVKAKSEVTLEYRLAVPGAVSPLVANTEKIKAESDGQDVISPMVERVAAAVTTAVTRKKS